jgi:transposase, IS5 family
MAHWIRGTHQRGQAATRPHPLGFAGMNRWVGLGVIADNVINIGRAMEKQTAP